MIERMFTTEITEITEDCRPCFSVVSVSSVVNQGFTKWHTQPIC